MVPGKPVRSVSQWNANLRPGFGRQDCLMPFPLLAMRRFALPGCVVFVSVFIGGCSSSTDGTTGSDSQGVTHVANRPVQPAVTDEVLAESLDVVIDATQRRHLS